MRRTVGTESWVVILRFRAPLSRNEEESKLKASRAVSLLNLQMCSE